MPGRTGSVVMIGASVATLVGGLFALGGVGAGADHVDRVSMAGVVRQASPTSAPVTSVPDSTVPATSAPVSSTTTLDTTTTTTTTTTTVPSIPGPLPISVTSPEQGPDGVVVVALGDPVTIEGQCEPGAPVSGRVELTVITDVVTAVDTGIDTSNWTYEWTPSTSGTSRVQAWCGDHAGFDDPYPEALELTVDIVEVGLPPTPLTVPVTTVDAAGPIDELPETD